MDVKEAARDTVYATIGVTSFASNQIQVRAKQARGQVEEQVKKLSDQVEEQRKARREQVEQWVSRVETSGKEVQEHLDSLNGQLRTQLDALVKLNEKAREQIEARLPDQVVGNIEQLRQQIRELTEQVQKQVSNQVEQVQKLTRRAA